MMDLSFYWTIFLRRLPILIVFMAIGAVSGVLVALSLPPTYSSSATLIVESEQIPDELAQSTVRTSDIEALQIIRQRILSREILLEMANRLDIYDEVAAVEMSADEKVADLRSRIGFQTVGGGARRGNTQATIVTVSFDAPTADLSALVANEVVTLILQENVQMRTSVATQTLDFFDQEVKRLEQSLTRVSTQILEFKEANLQSLPDSLAFRRARQTALQEQLLQLQRDQTVMRDRRSQLVSLFEATGQLSIDGSGRQALSPEAQNLAQLRREYASLAAVLSADNPRLVLMRSQIAAAEAALEAVPEVDAAAAGSGTVSESLFQIEIADMDAQIAYIADQIEDIETEMAQLERTISQTPGNAITLETLEREYENIQQRYNQAVTNRARAETGNIIESLSKGQRISVVEQAVPPTSPSKPNRPRIAIAGFGAATMLGAALVLALEFLNSAVRRPEDIQSALGIDVFATIPYIRTREEIWRRRVVTGGVVAVILIGLPLGLWYVDQQVTPLGPLVERILSRISFA